MPAAYLALADSGELRERARKARESLRACALCPRRCGVDRLAGETGFCGVGARAKVASFGPHFGEEAPLVGTNGSGTIFFSGCNLLCAFCQNFEISHNKEGEDVEATQLAEIMLELQRDGCHNINFVTPTHMLASILEATDLAASRGLTLPLVYNCGGYESVDSLRLLDGVVDIYMPDVKFADREPAERFCQAPDYPERARAALVEMRRQVGDLELDDQDLAVRGLLVRHLVMPGGLAGTAEWMRFLRDLSPRTYVNLMDQYRPCGKAAEHPDIDRVLSPEEYERALEMARTAGVLRLDDRYERQAFRLLQSLLRGKN